MPRQPIHSHFRQHEPDRSEMQLAEAGKRRDKREIRFIVAFVIIPVLVAAVAIVWVLYSFGALG